ncbi:MAG TPA: glycosyltransferase family protein [Syntrophorhabdales bacterium]|nr:glycosyltransferase family protein [Syntrophorhabdales bacterium]
MSRDKVKAIVQARMGSTRLPGKILKPLAGKPALWHVVNRLKRAGSLKEVVVATTTSPEDDVVVSYCEEHGIKWFRGSENDVLDRYYQAAKEFGADPIVRITADCPVIDPQIVDEVVEGFFAGGYDVYAMGGEFPDGLDCECFSFAVIEDTWKYAVLPSEREHVGVYPGKHKEKYRVGSYTKFTGLAHHRWTLDEEADLHFLQELYERLDRPGSCFGTREILVLLDREPELMAINSGIIRNEGLLKSLTQDETFLKEKSL